MVFGCTLFGIIANRIGVKKVLIIGTLGYAPYSASLYVNNRYGTEWFVLFGGVTCGIAASALWASEGAIALGYGNVKDRGKFGESKLSLLSHMEAAITNAIPPAGIWLGLRELGQLIGSSIQLSLNVNSSSRGKVGYTTYLVLIGLQCLGLPLAFLISPPEKVIHSDGRRGRVVAKNTTIKEELRKTWKLMKRKQMFLLVPILVGFQWNGTYLGIYMTK
jgi:MFS family permease